MPSSREHAKHHAHIDAANRLRFSINSMYGWVLPAQIFLMAPRYYCFWDLSFEYLQLIPTRYGKGTHIVWVVASMSDIGSLPRVNSPPRRHSVMARNFLVVTSAERMPLASDGPNPRLLLHIFLCTRRLLQQRITQPKMATVPRLKTVEVEREKSLFGNQKQGNLLTYI